MEIPSGNGLKIGFPMTEETYLACLAPQPGVYSLVNEQFAIENGHL